MKITGRLFMGLMSLVITLLLVEAGCRYVVHRRGLEKLRAGDDHASRPAPGQDVRLGEMIRLSENPRRVYELIPDLSVNFLKRTMTTNREGFRGPPVPVDKKPGIRRIVGLGDSVMFGWGVADEETYSFLLLEKLNADGAERWEIINTAVPGYNTVMQVETLKDKGLRYNPEIVIVHFVHNDLNLPNFIREEEDVLALNTSFLLKWLRGKIRHNVLVRAPSSEESSEFESNPRNVPEAYRDLVGIKAYRSAMRALEKLSMEKGFRVIVLAEKPSRFVKKQCSESGFVLLKLASLRKNHLAEQNREYVEAEWRLHKRDPHPSALGHQFIAELLFKTIQHHKG